MCQWGPRNVLYPPVFIYFFFVLARLLRLLDLFKERRRDKVFFHPSGFPVEVPKYNGHKKVTIAISCRDI